MLIFLFLGQKRNVHNINLVSPTSYIYNIKEAIKLAKSKGLTIPIIYNTNSYENQESIKELEELIDVYLADLKYFDNNLANTYSKAPNYFEHATKAILQMYYQVGKTVFFDNGIIKKGLIIRHLVLPGKLEDSKKILQWIKENIPKNVYVSIMSQYIPTHNTCNYPDINRKISLEEYSKIINFAQDIGITNIYTQELSSATKEYVPDF